MTWEDRQLHLIECLVAGNVFDWGAKEVADMLEKGDFGFKEAQNSLKRMLYSMIKMFHDITFTLLETY